ncbi:response regulator [Cellulosimicrobium protaetiae]|uniref:response regulator n=1 Tax=Cellulosimicrobium protaetiae TaxID=2587808 RepID=UPI001383D750|nr:response regulator transcription factor [Cellulosimicrobium protaetiae]
MSEDPATHHVLVVDDDPGLLRAIAITLRTHGWKVSTATSGEAGIDVVATGAPDVVLLDLGLPDLSGFDVIRAVRAWSAVPIVVLSARHLGDDKVDALDAGADDYVTKPFAMPELMARLRAAVRRSAGAARDGTAVVEAGDLHIDLARRRLLRRGAEVRLSPTEWALLEILVAQRGRVVEREHLLREVWGPTATRDTHYLRVYLAQLRRKLEDDPAAPRHLITSPGIGYRFEE